MNDITDLAQLTQNFRTLIIEQSKFCHFDQWLEENPDFAFPEITADLLDSQTSAFVTIPGLFGGFTYFLETVNGELALFAEQSSRMDHSSDDAVYFRITTAGSEILDGTERENVCKKFRDRAVAAHAARKQSYLADRARGMLVGLAIGDALGANLEFTITDHTDVTDEKIALYDGMWPKGAWTDDTSMALCLGNSLLECGGYDSYDVMQKYQRWVEEGYCSSDGRPAGDVGTQARAALTDFKTNPIVDRDTPRSEQAGNGVLMRLAPVVIATAHSPIANAMKLAQVSARETHYSYEAEASAGVFAAMLRCAMAADHDADKTQLVDVDQFSTGATYDDILNRVMLDSASERKVYLEDLDGYVVNALTIAVWGLRNFASFADGMRAVIKLGGDTDTNGAIYGQLAGAYYGHDQIPPEWKAELLRETEIRELADRLLAIQSCPIIRTRFTEDE